MPYGQRQPWEEDEDDPFAILQEGSGAPGGSPAPATTTPAPAPAAPPAQAQTTVARPQGGIGMPPPPPPPAPMMQTAAIDSVDGGLDDWLVPPDEEADPWGGIGAGPEGDIGDPEPVGEVPPIDDPDLVDITDPGGFPELDPIIDDEPDPDLINEPNDPNGPGTEPGIEIEDEIPADPDPEPEDEDGLPSDAWESAMRTVEKRLEALYARLDQYQQDQSRFIGEHAASRGLVGSSLEGELMVQLAVGMQMAATEGEVEILQWLTDFLWGQEQFDAQLELMLAEAGFTIDENGNVVPIDGAAPDLAEGDIGDPAIDDEVDLDEIDLDDVDTEPITNEDFDTAVGEGAKATLAALQEGWRPPGWETWDEARKVDYLGAIGMNPVLARAWLKANGG